MQWTYTKKDKSDNYTYMNHKKGDLETLRLPYVSFNDPWGHTLFYKKMYLYYVSIHRTFYQNWFINECARKKNTKIPQSRNHGMTEFLFERHKNLPS